MDIPAWLRELELGLYEKSFTENCIDDETLRDLTDGDLKELGVARLGHRKKLLAAITRLREDERARPQRPSSDLAGERREATILFADLTGFTQLSAEMDAEDLHALLNRYFGTVDGIVRDYGGSIDKHVGDSVMAVFGAPTAHANDPERAVRAAQQIHAALGSARRAVGQPLTAHIGIACGEVVASGTGSEHHREYTVTGKSVNLASRLEGLAEAGETLVSERVYRAVERIVDAETTGSVAVKGIDGPVTVWRITAVHDDRRAGWRTPFIGRRAELHQFAGIVEACRDSGSGAAMLVRGEAGVGKTRLVEECGREAEAHGFRTHRVLVLDFGIGKGQDATRSLVRSLLGLPADADEEARSRAAARAAAAEALADFQRACLSDLLDLPQPAALRAVYDAMDNAARRTGKQNVLSGLIRAATRTEPILLIIEDIHWADRSTIDDLAAIARTVTTCPAVLLMTTRIEGDPLNSGWLSDLGGASFSVINLPPLRPQEAEVLAHSFAGVAETLVEACIARAGGNPLFLEQLLLNAGERAGSLMPGSIRSLVLARMDALDATDRRALQAAAVIGQRFDLDTLRHLLDDPDYDGRALIEHYLVRPDGTGLLFHHALIQEGTYASLLKPARRNLHRRAASWFVGRDPILQAEHLDRAEDPAAPQAYLTAARAQLAGYRFERALALAERGLAIAASPDDRFALALLRGHLLHEMDAIEPCIEAYEAALAMARTDRERCPVWIGLASGMRVNERIDEAMALLDRAETVAMAEDMATELMLLHHLRGNLCFPLGRIEDCREQHERSLHHARRVGSAEGEARALGGLGDAAYARGRMQSARDHFVHCVEICRDHGFGRVEVANMSMVGHTRLYLLEFQQSAEDSRRTIEAAQRVGHARAELNARVAAFFAGYDLGEWAAARQHIERALEIVRQIGARRFEGPALNTLARILHGEGRQAEALACVRQAIAVNRETGITFEGPRAFGNLALITADPAERRQAWADAEAILAQGCVGHNHLTFYRDAMMAALMAHEWDEAERFAAALEAFVAAEPLPWSRFFVTATRTLAAHGRGERRGELRESLDALDARAEQAQMVVARRNLAEVLATIG